MNGLLSPILLLILSLHSMPMSGYGFFLADFAAPLQGLEATCVTAEALTQSTRLQPGCTYHQTLNIVRSGVELDCLGATIDGGNRLRDGIIIAAPKQIQNITVKNCHVHNFTRMGIYVTSATRPQARLQLGEEAQIAFTPTNVSIQQNDIRGNGLGVFVSDHVSHYSISGNTIDGNADVGLYLEYGSAHGVVEGNRITANGWHRLSRTSTQAHWPKIREGIAVDGSQHNLIYDNEISANAAGGIFLYRNCTEGGATNAEAPRRIAGASFNVLLKNRIEGQGVGIWIAQRQSQDLKFQLCGNPYYYQGKFTLDISQHNVVKLNIIRGPAYGIVIEDDDNAILSNDIQSEESCATVGTKYRSEILNRPVLRTTFENNSCMTENSGDEFIFAYRADRSKYGENFSTKTHLIVQPR